jgi:hypothetical protein
MLDRITQPSIPAPENIYIPDGTVDFEDLNQYCVDYEMNIKNAGGLDFQYPVTGD